MLPVFCDFFENLTLDYNDAHQFFYNNTQKTGHNIPKIVLLYNDQVHYGGSGTALASAIHFRREGPDPAGPDPLKAAGAGLELQGVHILLAQLAMQRHDGIATPPMAAERVAMRFP
jgi:hypothetical protein